MASLTPQRNGPPRRTPSSPLSPGREPADSWRSLMWDPKEQQELLYEAAYNQASEMRALGERLRALAGGGPPPPAPPSVDPWATTVDDGSRTGSASCRRSRAASGALEERTAQTLTAARADFEQQLSHSLEKLQAVALRSAYVQEAVVGLTGGAPLLMERRDTPEDYPDRPDAPTPSSMRRRRRPEYDDETGRYYSYD